MFKVALVDDHELFRKSLIFVLEQIPTIEVVFDTDDGNLLLNYLEYNTVDLILLDIQMPIMDGFTLCKKIKQLNTAVKILTVSQLTTKESIHQIFESGSNGFFSKNSSTDSFKDAVLSMIEKDYYFDISLSDVVKEAILWKEKQNDNRLTLDKDLLSPREKEIIFWSAKGLTCQQIADQLFISKRTVEAHRKTIMDKTSCLNIIEVVVFGLKERIITLEDL
ncbi:response regulator transcription factor [uncultured Flavobacterium sp.]|uniref:response regulator transcription factor n=1 Tax=uncultured Flavobacterium sp. TaxID=165435 RepID=UPI0011D6295D|nr:response regulator transcription factor [uncultured Flavobacterium sp.]TXI71780.1 MAG: response regulator transcription factor [Flavobacterium sp.]